MLPYLLLAGIELFCFGVFTPQLGFYHDDWTNLERLVNAGGLWGGIQFYSHLVLERPVASLQYPLLFALGGLHPLPYQLFFLAAEILEGWLLFLLFDRLFGWRELAFIASAVILIFPTHAVTHLWLSSAAMIVTVDLTLASLLFHHRWIQNRRRKDLLASQMLYLVGALNYEVAAFLPLLLAGAMAGGRLAQGEKPLAAAKRSLGELWPYGASLALALIWQRAVVSLALKRNPRLVGFSLQHAFKAYGSGLECATNRVVDVCATMMPVAWHSLGYKALIPALIFSAVFSWFFWRQKSPNPDALRRALWAALGAAVGGLIGAVAPYAASADYLPMVFGVMSRTNGVIAIGAGLFWALGLCLWSLRSRLTASLALGAIVFCMTLANWGHAVQWARSWRLQNDILKLLAPQASKLPDSSVILLTDFPISLEPGGALVFGAHWDIGAALRLATKRKLLAADVLPAAVQFNAQEVVLPFDADTLRRYPYQNLFLYSYGHNTLWRLAGPGLRRPYP